MINKRLLIFSGLGDPFSAYKEVYDLILEMSKSENYEEVSIINWPGHFSFDQTSEMNLVNAVSHAKKILKNIESENISYDVIGRSFGCSIFMKACDGIELRHLQKAVLWGPAPYYIMHKLFLLDINQTIQISYSKNVRISDNFFAEIIPFERLIADFKNKNPIRIAAGEFDKYCKPFHLKYYKSIQSLFDYRIVSEIGHEVSDYNINYFNTIFGFLR